MIGKTFRDSPTRPCAGRPRPFRGMPCARPPVSCGCDRRSSSRSRSTGSSGPSRYPGGVALRFARVKGYRDDKSAAEADTIEAVRSLLR